MRKNIIALAVLFAVLSVAGCSSVRWADRSTEAETAYFERQSEIFDENREIIDAMSDLNTDATQDRTLLRDREWLVSARAVHNAPKCWNNGSWLWMCRPALSICTLIRWTWPDAISPRWSSMFGAPHRATVTISCRRRLSRIT